MKKQLLTSLFAFLLVFLCVWDALKPKPEIKRQLPTPLKYRLKKLPL